MIEARLVCKQSLMLGCQRVAERKALDGGRLSHYTFL